MIEWTREGMAAYGWHWEEAPRGHHGTCRQPGEGGQAVTGAQGAPLKSAKRISHSP